MSPRDRQSDQSGPLDLSDTQWNGMVLYLRILAGVLFWIMLIGLGGFIFWLEG